jgi:hypothetical protein
MNGGGLNPKLVEAWQEAGRDLGIRVTAPAGLSGSSGNPFLCEAFVPDFGSPSGTIVVSRKTERRVRRELRGLEGVAVTISPERQQRAYVRKSIIDELIDWGWFGAPGDEPDWYKEKGGPPAPSAGPVAGGP